MTDILQRTGLAWAAKRSLDNLYRQQKIQLATKLAIYKTCIIPVLLYGAETWTLQSSDWRRLDAFHHQCQRHILQTKWSSVGQDYPPRGHHLTLPRLGLFGHVARLDSGVRARDALECAYAHRTKTRPLSGCRRPSRCRRQTWLHQTAASIRQEWAIGATGLRCRSILMMMMLESMNRLAGHTHFWIRNCSHVTSHLVMLVVAVVGAAHFKKT